jgi:uncharacterized membrane protein
MDLIVLVLTLALLGFLVWAITTYIPMPPIFKTAITIIVVVVIILYLIRRFAGAVPNVL